MLILAGTLPIKGLKLHTGNARLENGGLRIGGELFPVNRGTAAMAAACCTVCEQYGMADPFCVVSGDTGRGTGSVSIYRFLKENVPNMDIKALVLHYVMPIALRHNELMHSLKEMNQKPVLIADAGFMYVIKITGHAPFYDVFTPDLGELAFLADKEAPHPFYTRGFIFHMEDRVEKLIKLSYEGGNAARILCVKGKTDYICKDGEILEKIDQPCTPELEAIGGTGDTITGMIAALAHNGMSPEDASVTAAKVNRLAGKLTHPSPATQIEEIIKKIPQALEECVCLPQKT
jgi:hypothetical protein